MTLEEAAREQERLLNEARIKYQQLAAAIAPAPTTPAAAAGVAAVSEEPNQ